VGSGALAWIDKMIEMKTLYLLAALAPLAGAIIARPLRPHRRPRGRAFGDDLLGVRLVRRLVRDPRRRAQWKYLQRARLYLARERRYAVPDRFS
jgi:hypothetical protein